jgi:hypothetical protein
MQKFLKMLLLPFFCLTLIGCPDGVKKDDVCTVLGYVDLLVPIIIDVLDAQGNPIRNTSGQKVQDYNEIYYNTRTQEYFTHLVPPRYQILVGDVVQIGTWVKNAWQDKNCKARSSVATSTLPTLRYNNSPVGNLQAGYTPPINTDQSGFTYTAFQIVQPGYYKVDFSADNTNKNADEYNEDNNWYYGSTAQTLGKSAARPNGFTVLDNPNFDKTPYHGAALIQLADGTTEASYNKSAFVKFVQSAAYRKMYENIEVTHN